MSAKKCYVCGKITKFACCNIFKLKTSYSESPINSIIERISQKVFKFQLDLEEIYSCQECVLKINEYDEAYTKAMKLEEEILNIILKSEEQIYPRVNYTKLILRKNPTKNPHVRFKIRETVLQQNAPQENSKDECSNNETSQQVELDNETEYADELNLNETEYDDQLNLNETSSESSQFNSANACEDAADCSVKILSQWHQCVICNQAFGSKRKLDIHIKTHQIKHRCDLCDKTFKNEDLLKIHSQIHQGISELECSECSKTFSSKGALIKHGRIHRGEYIFQCEHCGKQFIHDSSMRMHKLIHEDVREKVCSICNFAFRSAQHLKRHLRTHTGEKPYYCDKCGKQFSQKYNLLTHCRKMHSCPVRKRRFKCIKCPQVFSQRYKLSEHISSDHGGVDNRAPTLFETEDNFYLEAEYLYPPDYSEQIDVTVK